MSSKIKEKEKEKKKKNKRKRKTKEKEEKGRENPRRFTLKPEHGPRGLRQKSLKPGALSLSWLGATDLVLATWVNG